jgi:CRISPR type III-A-associated RAMP protein Csm5
MTKMATFIDDEARILRFPWNTHTLNRDAFRGLIVGDAYQVDTQSATRLEKVAVVSPRGGGNPQSNRSVIAEVLSPGTVFKARIVLNDQIKPLLDKLNLGTGIETVLKCANRHSMRILSSDIAFFERFNKDCKFAGIIARLKELTKQVQEDQTNYALVRLGLGGGYVARSVGAVVDKAVTGWVAENFYKDKASPDYFPRSRRVTTEWERPKNIMGWAKLTIIDKE